MSDEKLTQEEIEIADQEFYEELRCDSSDLSFGSEGYTLDVDNIIPAITKQEQLAQLLILITPGSLGKGLTQVEAAKLLNISERTVRNILTQFKQTFPKEYEKFESICNVAKREAESLRWKTGLDDKNHLFSRDGGISLGSNLYEMEKKLDTLGHSIKGRF